MERAHCPVQVLDRQIIQNLYKQYTNTGFTTPSVGTRLVRVFRDWMLVRDIWFMVRFLHRFRFNFI